MSTVEGNESTLQLPVPRIPCCGGAAAAAAVCSQRVAKVFGPCVAELACETARQALFHFRLQSMINGIVIVAVQRNTAELRVDHNEIVGQLPIRQ